MIGVIGSGAILASFFVSLVLFFQVKSNGGATLDYFNFISVGKLSIPFAFQIDQLSSIFLLIITGIGFLIHVYSTAYMHDEPNEHFGRFFAYLNLFVFSMLLLVMGANYIILFIGWEGVGLCSYLLIGFWYKNNQYNYAARKAFVMNRIGDLAFLLAIFWMITKLGTVNYYEVFSLTNKLTTTDITAITLLLFVGACGKSAQIPLYTWLPDAMAGPTPVSALIHAATMVTAGIYMVCRSNILYTMAPCTQTVIAVVGLVTALFAASIALKQNDIKKVLAYSTVSQLGYMVLALGVGAYTGAIFHVMTHAFFKACLFLGAGSVIHAVGGNQDMRTMGGLKKYMPVTHITFLLSCFAIAGVPPFSGFFSKDEILAAAYNVSPVYYWLGVVGALMTAFYMFRLYAGTFLGEFKGSHEEEHHLHESPKAMTMPLIILALLAVVGGFVGIPEVFAKDANVLEHFLDPIFAKSKALQHAHETAASTELTLMAITTVLVIAMIAWAWTKYSKWKESYNENNGFANVLENAWYVDNLYNAVIVNPILGLASFLKSVVEKAIDGIVNGVGYLVQFSSKKLRLVQSGQVESYLLTMVLAIVVLFLVFWNQAHVLRFLHKIF